MREECASRRERGSSHHTGINAVGTQEKINVLGAESPSQLREGKAPPTQPPVRTKRKGHTQRLCLAVFFSVFRESAKTGRSMGWRVHGVRNRPFQHTYSRTSLSRMAKIQGICPGQRIIRDSELGFGVK